MSFIYGIEYRFWIKSAENLFTNILLRWQSEPGEVENVGGRAGAGEPGTLLHMAGTSGEPGPLPHVAGWGATGEPPSDIYSSRLGTNTNRLPQALNIS